MKLKRVASGEYRTLDGRYSIEHDEHRENDCECIICQQGDSLYCPHGGVRTERGWIIWDIEREDYMEGTGPLQFDTKRDAVEYLTERMGDG